jgi:paraquat-inducible protein B
VFEVYSDRAIAMKQPDAFARRYVLMFDEPVRGLSVGAPVTLMGLTVGEVIDVGLSFDPQTLAVHARVLVTFYPERAAAHFSAEQQGAVRNNTEQEREKHVKLLRRLVDERGLRAQLRSSSLITSQKYVSFEFVPHAVAARLDWHQDPLELPVAPGQITDMEAKLASILGKIDSMPIATIGERASDVLKSLDLTLKDADAALKDVDASTLPRVRVALDDLHHVLDSANATLIGRDAPGQQSLRDALEEVTRAARSLRELTDYLEQHPESLLRGKSKGDK